MIFTFGLPWDKNGVVSKKERFNLCGGSYQESSHALRCLSSQLVLLNSRNATLSITYEHQFKILGTFLTTISRHGTRPILNQFSSPFRGPSRWRGSTLLGKIQIVKAFITGPSRWRGSTLLYLGRFK